MKLGFTGTRKGMSDWQKRRLRAFLKHYRPVEFHHGDCVGADAQAHKIVRETLPECRIVAHPCDMPKMRANCKADETFDPKPPLLRNGVIVALTDELVAAPETDQMQSRSGTWAAVRYARHCARPVEILEREQPACVHSQNHLSPTGEKP